ncbi:MAG: transporter substrate-binding domain-containing protein [Hyphomicrobiales bacterium]|nr:transporter substrate-binding domain-containing protein [Hyphomicrobiales bacterium]
MLTLSLVVSGHAAAQEAAAPVFPLFRHIDSLAKPPTGFAQRNIRLLTDGDFPPFSYETPEGKAAGVSVDLALAACAELKANCSVVAKPFNALFPALLNNEGDAIVSGLRIDATVLKKAAMTRPYFWSLGRFAVRAGSQLRGSDIRSLAGRRIGYVTNSSHGAWLEKYYSRSTLTGFPGEAEMYEALRTGALDVSFGDGLRLIYWLAGSSSRGCCKPLDGAFVDRQFFSNNLSFLTRREDRDTVMAFDYALDRLQEKKISAEIFARYLPGGLW